MSMSKLTLWPWDAFLFHLVEDQGSLGTSLIVQLVKNLPARQETWVQSLGWEDPLQKGMATHSTPVFLPGESQGQSSLVGCRLWGLTELDMTEVS